MGLFNFFRKKHNQEPSFDSLGGSHDPERPEVTREKFIEEEKPSEQPTSLRVWNIEYLFEFLNRNHEEKGYDDALRNPDSSHLDQNLLLIKNELGRTIKKVKTFYEGFMKEIDFHIETRSRNGMIDTVDELKTKREIAQNHVEKIIGIETEAQNDRGDGQGVLLSYTRGFKNGLAAISHHSILKRQI